MGYIENVYNELRNKVLNSLGVERDLLQLINDKDISKAMSIFQNRDEIVIEAISEYNPNDHKVNRRKDKPRKGKEPYKVEKLPRGWQKYINEISLFFMYGNPIKWSNNGDEDTAEAFEAFKDFLQDTRFNTTQRQAKRIAGSETESAKLYHIYRGDNGKPAVKVVVLSKSAGYTLRPLFDQYANMLAFGYGYYLKEGNITVEHFDIQTPQYIYRCQRNKIGWSVTPVINPTGKINVIYNQQPKEWEGIESRINRDEMIDSKTADTNNYFADPMAAATTDVINKMVDPETVGKLIHLQDKNSEFRYIEPPQAPEMKEAEKKVLKESILNDSFTPDFSYDNMKGFGTLSGEALKRALILGYIKRDNRKEIYDINVDREKNLILAIMMNVTHIQLKDKLARLNIKHEFSEPFNEDKEKTWAAVGKAYSDGIISLETAVELLSLTDNQQEEIERIRADKQKNKNINETIQPIEDQIVEKQK